MKKTFLSLAFLFAIIMNSTLCYAATIPEFKTEGDNTILEVFKTSMLTTPQKDVMREWLSSSRNLLIRLRGGIYVFVIIPENGKIWFSNNSGDNVQVNFLGKCYGIAFSSYSDGFFSNPIDFSASSDYSAICTIVSGSIFNSDTSIVFPSPTSYLAVYSGDLILRDDGGLFGSPKPDENGLLSWLKNFWDSLLNFVKSIFVPENGYFEKWYNDIKLAADNKFSALSGIFNSLSSSFDSLQNTPESSSPLKVEFPANHFFVGSSAITIDFLKLIFPLISFIKTALTSCVVIYTAITCYKRLVVLFEQ